MSRNEYFLITRRYSKGFESEVIQCQEGSLCHENILCHGDIKGAECLRYIHNPHLGDNFCGRHNLIRIAEITEQEFLERWSKQFQRYLKKFKEETWMLSDPCKIQQNRYLDGIVMMGEHRVDIVDMIIEDLHKDPGMVYIALAKIAGHTSPIELQGDILGQINYWINWWQERWEIYGHK